MNYMRVSESLDFAGKSLHQTEPSMKNEVAMQDMPPQISCIYWA